MWRSQKAMSAKLNVFSLTPAAGDTVISRNDK
jgi:hypothetical protein